MKVSMNTKSIIEKMGYAESNSFFYFDEIKECKDLSFHDRKVMQELQPCGFFCVDGKPKVLFFDYMNEKASTQELYKKIWNAQVPIIIFSDYDCIKVFNGNSLELSDIDDCKLNFLFEEEASKCDRDTPFSYWNITNEKFLRQYQGDFSKDTLNEVMINNIKCVTDELKNKYGLQFATKLILRIIFIRFLIDRGIEIGYSGFTGDVKNDQNRLLELSGSKKSLYELFQYLKKKFNGNLFELGNELEQKELTDRVFDLLQCFISGKEEMKTGQLSFLPLYDFNIIPIELISNIYEILLGTEAQQNDKAFYTPEYLADYIVKETVATSIVGKKSCKVLDPACGSGIFLVQSLKQIISINLDEDGYIRDNDKLISLIEKNIYGVDLNAEAIDITIFSLYLTLFDYKDPKTLEGFKLPNLLNKNLFVSDFFDVNGLKGLEQIEFDYILGNPPWGSIKKGLHVQYCKDSNIEIQRYEISRSFIVRVKDFSCSNTMCALIVPSKIFYNQQKPAINFRKRILKNCEIFKFVEMSSVRKLIFKKADAPAAIVFFRHREADCLNYNMIHISLKPNMFFKLYHVIATEKVDIKRIKQDTLYENDWAWKTCVYGTTWDIENIRMLKRKYATLSEIMKENKLATMSGFSDNDGDYDATCYRGRNVIDATCIDTFSYDSNQKRKFDKATIYRLGKKDMYNPPYCLRRKGTNCQDYRLRSAFVDDDVIFNQALIAIKGNSEQKELLRNITGIINSSLYCYLNLMLGSSVGIEREQAFMDEIYQYPFVYDDLISQQSKKIQEKRENLDNCFIQDVTEDLGLLDDIVLKDFGLIDDPFVDYALNIQIPMINSMKWDYHEVTKTELEAYASVFFKYWIPIMQSQKKYVSINIFNKVAENYTVFELNISEEKPEKNVTFHKDVKHKHEIMSKYMITQINEQFYQARDVIYFENSSFYIIKTNESKNWHPAMAYMDNTSVVDTILSDRKGE